MKIMMICCSTISRPAHAAMRPNQLPIPSSTRTQPHITGDKGVYDTHGTVTQPGIQSHINYLDYQMWLYRNKLKEMGIEDNTVVVF